ncbi:MAG TPA: Omp28-related outer membrane protein [Bacteroidia bacterium]|nr:Omp28-related outer membrane protein [Bacteroidia bacterium]
MKKLYILSALGLSLLSGALMAQTTRLILAEEFTQASCGPCASQNPAFNTLLSNNLNKVVGLKYQTNWPGVDPMNTQTQTWVGPRVTYYGVTGVPHATLDGTAQTGGSYTGAPANWTQAKIDNRYAIMSPFSITASHTIDPTYTNMDITVDVSASQAVSGNLVLQVALVEKEISFCQAPGTNGEKEFYGVMRKMIPDAAGTAISNSWTAGQSQQYTFSTAIPSYIYDMKQLAVVVFIQNNTGKEVLQAGISEPLPVSLDASIKDCSQSPVTLTCSNSYNPSVTLTNYGTSTITSVDFSYSVTGSGAQTYNWTGSLAAGASTSISIPTINIASFPSTFNCSITSVNGGNDVVTGNNTTSVTLYQIPTTATVAPVVQDFVPVAFPPTNWNRINGGGTATWTRSGVGASAANGSAKMDFYNSADGDVDALYTPKIDLTGLNNPEITFMVAKAQYATTYIDHLEVLASSDCGATWTVLWSKADPQLTTAGILTSAYTASSGNTSQWRFESASMSAFAGQPEVLVAFRATSGFGNNLYLDDINIQNAVGIGENASQTSINVFPSVTTGDVIVSLNSATSSNAIVTVLDATGKLIDSFKASADASNNVHVNLANRQNGMYFIQVETEGQKIVKKVVLEN